MSHWQTYTILMIVHHPTDISPVRVHPCRLVSVSKRLQCPSLTHNQGSVGTSELKLGRTSQSEWWSFTEQHVLDIGQPKLEIEQLTFGHSAAKRRIF